VRQEAVLAAGRSDAGQLVPALMSRYQASAEQVRTLILQALGQLGGNEAGRFLEGVATDQTATSLEKVFARKALRACKGRI
ncbi:MAG: HEAT repeat domain-containing protein, partial [Planctomycetota bacterium]